MEPSDDEYDEWFPSVLKRWDALMEREERNGKLYTAFLRFALKCYDIPAKVKAIWTKVKRGSGKFLELQIEYIGRARTTEEMFRKHGEIREIMSAFPPYMCNIEYGGDIKYYPRKIWELNECNGPTYFQDLMCIGKGSIPHIPRDVRALIKCC